MTVVVVSLFLLSVSGANYNKGSLAPHPLSTLGSEVDSFFYVSRRVESIDFSILIVEGPGLEEVIVARCKVHHAVRIFGEPLEVPERFEFGQTEKGKVVNPGAGVAHRVNATQVPQNLLYA